MCCIGKNWMNCKYSYHIEYSGSIPNKYAFGKNSLTSLSLHFPIMQERRNSGACECMSDVSVLYISLS